LFLLFAFISCAAMRRAVVEDLVVEEVEDFHLEVDRHQKQVRLVVGSAQSHPQSQQLQLIHQLTVGRRISHKVS
jgi:hypothetical protein